ncbi:ATP-binding cassette domain-containing protein [Mesomycoplasma molare]|uniref:ATP-binding cassette domain-containing protein n=1 Tax=Mesomycoplasma molare TaxID=171288 RepID=A0ABY5TUQ3_9BACT|nr:ATP-binding cassette domain-containing protein [Mesomycoplasma molare]UWD34382.1 ATP-binding cassette domain-containing protein [Mesomycoplasma molare]
MKTNKEKTILDVKNLKKYFYTKKGILKAVDNVNFKLFEGEVLGLIGESGSGKTTVGRSIIRLYDRYNGQVTLENKIISGKRIGRTKDKFMRKNMQMIFQDPHASLNGQKNVYSILKEPLKVNGIIKEKLVDIFTDWEKITENFKYTFLRKYLEQKLDNKNSIINEANEYFKEWEYHFDDFDDFDKMSESNSDEDIFNAYFAYLAKRQFHESKAINQMYRGVANLYNFYFEKQKEYRDGNLSFDEKELRESNLALKEIERYTKNSRKNVSILDNIKTKEKELREFAQKQKEEFINSKNYINNYIYEFKSEYLLNKNSAIAAENFKDYSFFYKRAIVNKITKDFLENKKSLFDFSSNILYWLSVKEIDEFVNLFNDFNIKIIEKYENKFLKIKNDNNEVWNSKKELESEFLSEYASLDLDKYFDLANSKKIEFNNYIESQKTEILKLKSQVSKEKEIDKVDLIKFSLIKAIHKKNLHIFDHELANFKKEFDIWEANILEKIESKKIEVSKISEKQKVLDAKFKEIHNKFLAWLTNKLQQNGLSKKEIKHQLDGYNQKINEKLALFKSFNLELKVLDKIYYRVLYLLGLHKDQNIFLTKQVVKKVMYDEAIYSALEEVGLLRQFAYRYPHEFSGGQRQRIVIARALISQPKVIIADEPIASLDISIQAQIVNLLKNLVEKKGIGLIFIAHDLSMVEYIADNIIIMHLGKIVERGKTEEIYSNPKHPYTINLFKSIPKMSNAHEPFEASNFELNYLKEQNFLNPIEEKLVNNSKTHKVYGTKNQLEKWLNNNEK